MADNSLPKDTSWIRSSFLSLGSTATEYHRYHRSSGWFKYTDTSLGGNWAINCPYQFTRYADIKEQRLMDNVGFGMGRWYSEHIDEYGHNVHFRVGVPAYSGVLTYLLSAIDGYAARYVATGRVPGFLDGLGQVAGYIISAAFWEVTLLAMALKALIALSGSKFYYLKPTMFQYWTTVQTMLNAISANLGLTVLAQSKENKMTNANGDGGFGEVEKPDLEAQGFGSPWDRLPEHWGVSSRAGLDGADIGIDIHAVASRAQALQVQHQLQLREFLNQHVNGQPTIDEFMANYEAYFKDNEVFKNSNGVLNPNMSNKTLRSYQHQWTKLEAFKQEVKENATGQNLNELMKESSSKESTSTWEGVKQWFSNTVDSWQDWISGTGSDEFATQLIAEWRDGSSWVSFRADNSADNISESFSNSSEPSDVAQMFNSFSSGIQKAFFSLGGMKSGIAPIDSLLEGAVGGMGDVITGAAKNIPFVSPLMGLLYGSQIEVPKRWSSSSSSLSPGQYTFKLRAGYGNTFSIFQDLYVPLVMLLVLALPRGTGPQSYAQPFYVEFYSKGRNQSRIGLVSSLNVSRGVGNMGWTKKGLPLGIDITISIEDMTDKLFTPPMSSVSILDQLVSPFEENAMSDYLAILSGLGMLEQNHLGPRISRGWNMLMNQLNSWTSKSRWAAAIGEDSFISKIASYTARR